MGSIAPFRQQAVAGCVCRPMVCQQSLTARTAPSETCGLWYCVVCVARVRRDALAAGLWVAR